MCDGSKGFTMLKISLGKRLPSNSFCDDEEKISRRDCDKLLLSRTVLGYYDTLNIYSTLNFYSMRPGCDLPMESHIKKEYTLRLVNPSSDANDVDDWIGEQGKKYPLLACCMVHFSDEYLKSVDNYQDFINGLPNISDDSVATKTLFDMGFSDAAVLMFGNSINKIRSAVCQIHGEKSISSVYTIIAYAPEENILQYCADEEVSAPIDIAFCDGVPYSQQSEKLRKIFGCESVDTQLDAGKIATNTLSMMFGSYDWRCTVTKSLKDFLLFHDKYFNPYNDELACYRLVETRLLMPIADPLRDVRQDDSDKSLSDAIKNAYKDFLTECTTMAKKHNSHHRAEEAVCEVISLYNKVTSTTHCLDVKNVVGQFIVGYLTTVNALIMHMESDPQNSTIHAQKTSYSYTTYPDMIEQSIGEFREAVETLLFDIWRSDSAYFEGQSTDHPTVGSAAKLLFTYNRALKKWDDEYKKSEAQKDGDDEYEDTDFVYLVTSGGRDITVNKDLFDGNRNVLLQFRVKHGNVDWCKNCADGELLRRPIIVTVPEASLYDIKGSLLRMAHEFYHKRGDRQRKTRAIYFFNSLCDITIANFYYGISAKLLKKRAKKIFSNRFYRNTEYRHVYAKEKSKNGKEQSDWEILYKHWLDDLCKSARILNYNGVDKAPLSENQKSAIIKEFEEYGISDNPNGHIDSLINAVFDLKTFYGILDAKSTEARQNLESGLGTILRAKIDESQNSFSGKIAEAQGKAVVDDVDWSSKRIYQDVSNIYNQCLNTPSVVGEIVNKVSEYLRSLRNIVKNDPAFGAADFLFLKKYLEAYCNDINHCAEIWHDYVACLNNWRPNMALIVLTDCQYDIIRSPELPELIESLYTECFADWAALASLGYGNSKDSLNRINEFLDYIFTSVFEQRDYKKLFNDKPVDCIFVDNEVPAIQFNSLLLQCVIIKNKFWPNITGEEFKQKEDQILKQITVYCKDKLYMKDSNIAEYAQGLFDILLRVIYAGEKFCRSEYTKEIFEYIRFCDGYKIPLGNAFDTNGEDISTILPEDYVGIVINQWLSLFRENEQ